MTPVVMRAQLPLDRYYRSAAKDLTSATDSVYSPNSWVIAKQLKGWRRERKNDLVRTLNPEFRDLMPSAGQA
jgi:hypothetical protein